MGVSKALIFHHFKSNPDLYLAVLDRSVAAALEPTKLDECGDFFAARERFSLMKLEFASCNPNVYRVLKEACFSTPEELLGEIAERHNALVAEGRGFWRRRFAGVPLRKGVDRSRAFELIMLAIDHFESQYIAGMTEETEPDRHHVRRFLRERNRFLDMIRFGVQAREGT